ncbi:hypothetical protein Lesp02_54130 [Lentzea sp. NBRC 105346]|uniref:hypothetical protein n=1 Tax=Lentzea sp. NBRC 105346 TaxID=3032205 RepID=UPI0024A052A9|nr:hypothetical protein [Lentzea sp. NBRC 105346]GLZ33225.1 hypothetical protein Lesp02_54130 [Lentzea sp. NBRC 105346]
MTFPYDQARLQALFDDVDSRISGLDQVAQQASQVRTRSKGLSEQDIAEIERFARTPGAPKELKDIQRRVESGEMSWQDISAGRVVNDEGVQKALATGLPDLQRAYSAIQEGQDVEDVIESGRPRAVRRDDDDDEPTTFTKDAW